MKSAECRMTAKARGIILLFCIHHSAFCTELVEPEVVATSPYRFKRPVPVCCGFDSVTSDECRVPSHEKTRSDALLVPPATLATRHSKWYSRQDLHLHWRRSQRRVSAVGLREQ